MQNDPPSNRCLTIEELARQWRVGVPRVRELIRRGIVTAIDLGAGTPRRCLRVSQEAIRQAERALVAAAVPTPRRRRDAIDPEIEKILLG